MAWINAYVKLGSSCCKLSERGLVLFEILNVKKKKKCKYPWAPNLSGTETSGTLKTIWSIISTRASFSP